MWFMTVLSRQVAFMYSTQFECRITVFKFVVPSSQSVTNSRYTLDPAGVGAPNLMFSRTSRRIVSGKSFEDHNTLVIIPRGFNNNV